MLTKNGKAFLYARNCDKINNLSTTCTMLNRDRSSDNLEYYYNGNSTSEYTYAAQSLMIIVGSETTTPEVEDFNLKSLIIDNDLSVISRNSRNYETRSGTYINSPIMHATVTYQNTKSTSLGSEGNFVVNEIGLIAYCPTHHLGGWTTSIFDDKDRTGDMHNDFYGVNPTQGYSFLLAREVLETPVVIAPGETATFTITVA